MQSKSNEISLCESNINLSSSQSTVYNHGTEKVQLRSPPSAISLKDESCLFKIFKDDHQENTSQADDAILLGQPNQVWSDKGITTRSNSMKVNFLLEDELLSSILENDKKAEFGIKSRSKSGRSFIPPFDQLPNEVLTVILSYLPASSITAVALVSKRFNVLVTTPHVWRAAFSRSFQGPSKPSEYANHYSVKCLTYPEESHSELRLFNRLTTRASWRSEYILRTRLLCSLERGKPGQLNSKSNDLSRTYNKPKNLNPILTYSSHLVAAVSHIHAVFDSEKKNPRFIHGASESNSVTMSDSVKGVIGEWRLSESELLSRFSEVWTGNPLFGLGDGPVGVPNSMDISLLHGIIIGEGIPAGRSFYQSCNEMRGRYLHQDKSENHEIGIPRIPESIEGVSAVWIAKSHSIPKMTDGLIGMLRGSTLGVVTAYSSGFDIGQTRLIPKGFATAKWVLSPGVPIIAFDIDDSYNSNRKASGRIWAVALNALGEVFYLSRTPSSKLLDKLLEIDVSDRYAWNVGRTVYWSMIENSRRVLRDDPYHTLEFKATHSPRSSPLHSNLSQAQLKKEALEIEKFFQYTPTQFRKAYDSWDMRRRLHVDFAGDDGSGAGEAVFVIKCGTLPKQKAEVMRMTKIGNKQVFPQPSPAQEIQLYSQTTPLRLDSSHFAASIANSTVEVGKECIFNKPNSEDNSLDPELQFLLDTEKNHETEPPKDFYLWQSTIFCLNDYSNIEITSSAIDMSTYALCTANEDPMSLAKFESEISYLNKERACESWSNSIPGNRARFLVVGTNIGSLIIWNMRGTLSQITSNTNELQPFRKIYTDSPEISSIAVSALYIVHGGSDGLVQAWDPLKLKSQPIRTLHSRSSRTHRRITRNESPSGPGSRTRAAGAIILDHDPLRLRGIVSIGTQLRYWSYSGTNDDITRKKRRQSHEGSSNSGSDRFSKNGRGAMRDYINTEQEYFRRDEIQISRENALLRGRFGVGICGLTEEETIRYAELISAEEFEKSKEHNNHKNSHLSDIDMPSQVSSKDDLANPDSGKRRNSIDNFSQDILEAIRLSLLEY